MPIGIESSHGFGDLCFNLPLIRAIKEKHNDEIWVASRPHCKDALYNTPFIDKIIDIPEMQHGIHKFKSMGFKTYQITQNIKFFEFRNEHDPHHSLINTPLMTGRQLQCNDFDNRPLYYPTETEIQNTNSIISDKPTIAVESIYTSGQSWADTTAFNMILDYYSKTHRILWLSNNNAPRVPVVDNLLRFSRRECIMCLRSADIFFSVGSGFFCASLALPKEYQPKKIVCLWIDDLYKYEEPLNKYKWHTDITWVHNHIELKECLKKLQQS